MYFPEADVEYLIRTLSEARSRATELAASMGARLGTEHRLAELANSASSKIETLLRAVRVFAAHAQDGHVAQNGFAKQDVFPKRDEFVQQDECSTRVELEREHWLPMFVEDLNSQLRASGGITFEVAERLLQQRKDDFLRDFLVARRMYRTYPHLFLEVLGEIARPRSRSAAQ